MKRLIVKGITIAVIVAALVFPPATSAFAANPPGTGQPNQECGSATAPDMPPGFGTNGFAHAETVYAGSEGSKSAEHSNSDHSVAQYDVACFQVSQH